MRRIVEIDAANQVAVCEPFVRLSELYSAAAEHGLTYAVFPGEDSATVGGCVGTNAGGMQTIKYGVTRHHVLGLTAILADGRQIRCGGKYAKASSGYDLTQLIVGSEGTLAVVTEVILKLVPHLPHVAPCWRRSAPSTRSRARSPSWSRQGSMRIGSISGGKPWSAVLRAHFPAAYG